MSSPVLWTQRHHARASKILNCTGGLAGRAPRRFNINTSQHGSTSRRYLATAPEGDNLSRTRNIGIIAHIDAGKTTTTERMLYYSGFTRRIGDVDQGSTVTDFLPMERARGITIQSAAITFHWPPITPKDPAGIAIKQSKATSGLPSHTINLIDTPGHADFTFEVLRSLRVLDGAVCILDGVAGVEAQTEKVWHQASVYHIPRIIYVNKLDREGAAFGRTVKEIGARLMGYPAVCQIPWWEGSDGVFVGLGDIVHLQGLRWSEGSDGKTYQVYSLEELETKNPPLAQEMKKGRVALVELLSEHDDGIIELFEHHQDHLAIPAIEITKSLRRCLLAETNEIIPVFAGASFKNMGVQPLLDAIVQLLPAPTEKPDPEIGIGSIKGGLNELISGRMKIESPLEAKKGKSGKKVAVNQPRSLMQGVEGCALAFKVVHDARRGPLVYVRVYSGMINGHTVLYNTNLHLSERPLRLLTMYASDAVDTPSISAGQIGAITGLKHARTGDTLISYTGANAKTGPPAPINDLQLRPIEVPPPVFFASAEPRNASEEKHLAECLALLLREDPSLQVSLDDESGQTLLSGMGELHLEIARDRLVNDFKAKAEVGQIEISFRETVQSASAPQHYLFEKDVAGRRGKAGCTATVAPFLEADDAAKKIDNGTTRSVRRDDNLITIVQSGPEPAEPTSEETPQRTPPPLSSEARDALVNGAQAGLSRSPNRAYPLHSTHVTLTISPTADLFGSDSTTSALTSAARFATQKALRAAASASGLAMMEPVMKVTISVDEPNMGVVASDINSARGGTVLSLDDDSTTPISGSPDSDRTPIPADKIYAPPDPFAGGAPGDGAESDGGAFSTNNRPRNITATVPLKEMVGYLKHLRSLTGGRGSFVMSVDRFERMSKQRERLVFGDPVGRRA